MSLAAFAGMAGTWSGGGTVTLDDGSSERIRCRATYKVGGPNIVTRPYRRCWRDDWGYRHCAWR